MRLRKLRQLESYEYDVLPTFLYNSIYQNEDDELLDYEVIKKKQYNNYIADFGKETDNAIVWEIEGRIAGLGWSRLFHEDDDSFGYVDENTPEITLSVLPGYDVQLIGPELIGVLFNELKIQGYKQVSINVDARYEYLDMLEKLGFEEFDCCGIDERILYIKKLEDES